MLKFLPHANSPLMLVGRTRGPRKFSEAFQFSLMPDERGRAGKKEVKVYVPK